MYKQCSVDGCERNCVAKGLCDLHYRRQLVHGHLESTRPADWGTKEKHPFYGSWRWMFRGRRPIEPRWHDFWNFVADVGERPSEAHKLWRLDESKPYGPSNFFWREAEIRKRTDSDKEYRSRWQKEWRKRNPEKARSITLKKFYGITAEQYDAMLDEQGGVCKICGEANKVIDKRTGRVRALSVDHCHTGLGIRSLLCQDCNNGLGDFHDDPKRLQSAIEYLKFHSQNVGDLK